MLRTLSHRAEHTTRRQLLQRAGTLAALLAVAALSACATSPALVTTPPGSTSVALTTSAPAATASGTAPTSARAAPTPAAATANAPAGAPISVAWMTRGSVPENKWEKDVAIPQFQKAFPTIKVEWLNIAYADYVTKSMVMGASGTAADIWGANGGAGTRAYAAAGGMIQSLSPFIQRDKVDLSVYPKAAVDFLTLQGHVVGLPFTNNGSFVFYNKDLFQAAGVHFPPSSWEDKTWTVDALRSTALKLTSNPGQANAKYGLTVQNNDTGWGMGSWLWGGDPYSVDGYATGYPSQCHFDAPPVQSSYTYFSDLIVKDHVSPSADDVKSMALSKAPFIEQRSAMHMVGGWYIQNLKGVVKFNLGIAAFPRATTNVAPIWPDSYVMSATTRHPDQAWTLLHYLIGTEGQQGFMQSTGSAPSDQRLLDQWYKLYTFIPTAELKQAVEGSFVNARIIILKELVDFVHIDSALEPLLTPMYQGKATVATTLQQVQRAITTALAPNVGKRLCSTGASFGICQ